MRKLFHFLKQKLNLETIRNNRKKLAIFLLTILMLIFITSTIDRHTHNADNVSLLQNKRSETILRELNDISATLNDVSSNSHNAKQQAVLQSLEKEIQTIQQSIGDVAKGSDIQKMSGQIILVKDDIDSQINDLKKTVSESLGNKQYLDTDALPFHVISVDVIAGQPYVSVDYANHISPLAISDLLAGWRVISADYDLNTAEFVNEKNQYVKVSLQEV